MEMAFLQERRYRPYAKWFGTALAELNAAATLGPLIDSALSEPPSARADLTHTDDAMINFTAWPRLLAQCYRTMLQTPR